MSIVTFGTRKLVNFGKAFYMRLGRIMAFTVKKIRGLQGQHEPWRCLLLTIRISLVPTVGRKMIVLRPLVRAKRQQCLFILAK